MTTHAAATAASASTRGWGLTLRIAALATLASLALFASAGVSEASVRMWIRGTARGSIALFLLAFAARPLVQLSRAPAARWLLANRRYLGVAGAYVQALHLAAIVWLFSAFATYQPNLVGLVGGGLGFAFYFAMAATSSDAAQAALGKRAWKALHTVGAYWIWGIFALTNSGNLPVAFARLGVAHQVLYVVIEAALFAGLGLRIAAALRGRARGTEARPV
jgi:hypothetical protein